MSERVIWSLAALVLLVTAEVAAQPTTTTKDAFVVTPIYAGECAVLVRTHAVPGSSRFVQLELNKNPLTPKLAGERREMAIGLTGPLDEGDALRVRVVGPEYESQWSDEVAVAASNEPRECQVETPTGDNRRAFIGSGLFGFTFNNFAPERNGSPEDALPESPTNARSLFGTSIKARLIGSARDGQQLWVIGNVLYSGRAPDLNLKKPSVDGALTALDKADGLDAYLAVRWELRSLQADAAAPIKLFLSARYGITLV